ncbi:hypothetical protein B0H13DRAFT_2341955 [Mycena leptocephala]|nr:hypothetical protein B0H13DRAFT_2341955 [Mycena leptocephala]
MSAPSHPLRRTSPRLDAAQHLSQRFEIPNVSPVPARSSLLTLTFFPLPLAPPNAKDPPQASRALAFQDTPLATALQSTTSPPTGARLPWIAKRLPSGAGIPVPAWHHLWRRWCALRMAGDDRALKTLIGLGHLGKVPECDEWTVNGTAGDRRCASHVARTIRGSGGSEYALFEEAVAADGAAKLRSFRQIWQFGYEALQVH